MADVLVTGFRTVEPCMLSVVSNKHKKQIFLITRYRGPEITRPALELKRNMAPDVRSPCFDSSFQSLIGVDGNDT